MSLTHKLDVADRLREDIKEWKMEQNYVIIDVSTTKYPVQFAIIDAKDVEKVAKHKWCMSLSKRWNEGGANLYPVARINGVLVRLHRFIMNAKKGQIIDHINNNGLDNRKCNLRFVTPAQSMWNTKRKKKSNATSKFEGVCRPSSGNLKNPYFAKISINGQTKNLGSFATEKEAHDIYEKEAKRIKGEYRRKEEQ